MSRAFASTRSENLISFALVTGGAADEDVAALTQISDYAKESFEFFEVIILAAAPPPAWVETIRKCGTRITNLRCIVFENRRTYDELVFESLSLAIGDYILCDGSRSASASKFNDMLKKCREENLDIVKSFSRRATGLGVARLVFRVIQYGLYTFLGRKIEADVERAICLSRSAAARLVEGQEVYRYFRLVTLADQFHEGRLELSGRQGGSLYGDLFRKAQIAAFLVSTAAERLLIGVVILSTLLCISGIAYALYSLVVWLALEDVAEGWTSLSLVLSALFATNFAVLAAVAVGLLQLLRYSRGRNASAPSLEINNSDLFSEANNLNIEIVRE